MTDRRPEAAGAAAGAGPAVERRPDTTGLSLYEFQSCPYCARVRNAVAQLGLEIESRDIQREPDRFRELVEARGSRQVPVLRIEDAQGERWLPESEDIIRYLTRRFAP